jgi:type IV secretion system protein VirB10
MSDKQTLEKEYSFAPKRRASLGLRLGLGVLLLAGTAIIAYPLVQGSGVTSAVETSKADDFQDQVDGDGFGRMTAEAEPTEPRSEPRFDPGPIEDELAAQRLALEEQNAKLARDVVALQAQLARLAEAPAPDNSGELADALRSVQEQNTALIAQLQSEMDTRLAEADLMAQKRITDEVAARARVADGRMEQLMEQILGLQRQNDALQQQIDSGMSDALRAQSERDQLAAEEAARRAELEHRRAEAAALRDTQIRSEGVIFDTGGKTGSPASDPETGPAIGDAAARAFVLDGAQPVQVATAEIIANPSNTVLQGTLIQASLETAIDSTLPGQITAIVNYPVWSFDQSRILIPEGSRLFGTYNSNVSLGQARILVGWSRIVTPEGQSVQLAAFGADDQGRSGVTGSVNSRFGLRFGTAALLSIIGAGPAIAASEANSDTGTDVAEGVAGSFTQTTDAVIGEYASLPPIISVQPGAAISVIVDRDLEFY